MDLGLKGRVALVTGAGRGVGQEIMLALAREGAHGAVNYLKSRAGAEGVAGGSRMVDEGSHRGARRRSAPTRCRVGSSSIGCLG